MSPRPLIVLMLKTRIGWGFVFYSHTRHYVIFLLHYIYITVINIKIILYYKYILLYDIKYYIILWKNVFTLYSRGTGLFNENYTNTMTKYSNYIKFQFSSMTHFPFKRDREIPFRSGYKWFYNIQTHNWMYTRPNNTAGDLIYINYRLVSIKVPNITNQSKKNYWFDTH